MNMLGIGKIDDLHKEYELQKREVYRLFRVECG